MSPQRAQRRAAWAMVAGVVGIAALILSVWLVGERAASDIRASESNARREEAVRVESARVAANANTRAGCARGVARDFEAYGTNRDLRRFALDAARARRASGDGAIARRYLATASRAEFRMRRIKTRLPAHEDEATIAAFCRVLFPVEAPSG